MSVWLATSCLQGRRLSDALSELSALEPAGLQLAPGCVPDGVDAGRELSLPTRTHHGFSWRAYRTPVWDGETLIARSDSVHPPKGAGLAWVEGVGDALAAEGVVFETMYPGYALGCGDEVERAMALGWTLAVDVSHVYLQLRAGAMTDATWRRLRDYPRVAEVHVSANEGRHDTHRPLTPRSFGLEWARERGATVPLVLECYFHRLSIDARREQMAWVRGE